MRVSSASATETNPARAIEAWAVFYRPGAKPHSAFRVLMVEDDPDIAAMFRFQLEKDGYDVSVARTSDAAFALIATAEPDVILLDVNLPGRSGVDLLEDLVRRRQADRIVAFLTNLSDPKLIQRGLALGAIDYLMKSSITPNDLSSRIHRWLQSTGGESP